MMSKKNAGRAFGVLLATVCASFITVGVHVWRVLPIALAVLIFIGLWIGFYLTGIWALNERPAELDKKFPISSKERRKRKTVFYDWLDSRGRR
jgi:hypothetical protein